MLARNLTLLSLFVLAFATAVEPARAQDMQICYDTADKVTDGGTIDEAERKAAHEACQRALAADFERGAEIPSAGGRFRHSRPPAQAGRLRRRG